MPARRKKRRRRRSKTKKARNVWPILKYFLGFFVLIVVLIVGWFFLSDSEWDKEDRFVMAEQDEKGVVALVVYDPILLKITSYEIPLDVQMNVAAQKGEWPIGSVWELSQNEGMRGELLQTSIMKTYGLPVDGWTGSTESSLGLKDRIKLFLFLMNSRVERIMFKMPEMASGITLRMVNSFSVRKMFEEGARVDIINKSGSNVLVHELTKVIGVMGSKVVSVSNEEKSDIFCEIRGKRNLESVKRIKNLYDCEYVEEEDPQKNVEVEIIVGEGFLKRF